MKILWVNTNFLHPTTKGGQIRTLEILRQLHAAGTRSTTSAFEDPAHPEGLAAAGEYCARAYPFTHAIPRKRPLPSSASSRGACSRALPLAVSRFHSPALRHVRWRT